MSGSRITITSFCDLQAPHKGQDMITCSSYIELNVLLVVQ